MSIKDVIKNVENPNWNNLTQQDTIEILKTIDYLLDKAVPIDTQKTDLPNFVVDKVIELELNKEELETNGDVHSPKN